MTPAAVFQEIRPGARVNTGDFVRERLGGLSQKDYSVTNQRIPLSLYPECEAGIMFHRSPMHDLLFRRATAIYYKN